MHVETRSPRALPTRQTPRAYLFGWAAVAAFGLGYLGVAATRPDLLAAILPLTDQSQDQAAGGRSVADIADEIASLRRWVHDLQHEVAATRSTLQDQATQGQVLAQRMAAAEERLSPVKEARVENGTRPTVQRLPVRTEAGRGTDATAATPTPPEGSTPPATTSAASVKVLNGTAANAGITTGSLPAASPEHPIPPAAATPPAVAAPAFGPAKVTAAPAPGGPRGIIIANADSLESLRARWGDLSERNADVLGSLAPRYRLAADAKGSPFTLLAGPFGTTADATRTCAALRAKGVACRVTEYAGSAF